MPLTSIAPTPEFPFQLSDSPGREAPLELDPQVNLFLGRNGSGKTRLLKSIADQAFAQWTEQPGPEPQFLGFLVGDRKMYPSSSVRVEDDLHQPDLGMTYLDLWQSDLEQSSALHGMVRSMRHPTAPNLIGNLLKTFLELTQEIIPECGLTKLELKSEKVSQDYWQQLHWERNGQPADPRRFGSGHQSMLVLLLNLLVRYWEFCHFPGHITDKPAIVVIDDIDRNLHPDSQRRIFPALTARLPNLQIFAAAHGPLTSAGLAGNQVHRITRNTDGTAIIHIRDNRIVSRNAAEISHALLDETESANPYGARQ